MFSSSCWGQSSQIDRYKKSRQVTTTGDTIVKTRPADVLASHGSNGSNCHGEAAELASLLGAMQAVRAGDFSVRLSGEHAGTMAKIASTFNAIVAANQQMAQQLEKVGETVGREGRTRQRVKFANAAGSWGEMEQSVNTLIDDLLWPVTW